MRKLKTSKLSLDRETLAPLQSDALDGINGGASLGGLTPTLTRLPTVNLATCLPASVTPTQLRVCGAK